MDTLTHTVLGACLGEAIAGKQLGKKAMLIGAIVNNLPDTDVISHFFTSPAEGLLVHRGITHSILTAVILSPLLAYALKKLFKTRLVSLQRWLLLIGSGMFLHILMDSFTSYGTGWFEPFSHYRVSFNVLFIIDPFFMLPLLIATIALLILKPGSPKRESWFKFGLGLSFFYLAVTICLKLLVNQRVQKDLSEFKIPHADYMVTPTPLNNMLWYVITENKNDCYVAYYSVFDKAPNLDYERFTKNDSLLVAYKDSPEIKKLFKFSKGYYQVSKDSNDVLTFSDLRFGQIGGWYIKQAPFVYNFNIAGSANGVADLQRGRMQSFSGEPLMELIKRIKGRN